MNAISFLFLLLTSIVSAEVYEVRHATVSYEVNVLIKKVTGESNSLKGKIDCPTKECEFLLAVPVKTFTSSDGNRDSNMLETIEASKYPLALARGKFPKLNFKKANWVQLLEVDFHGVKKTYQAKIQNFDDGQLQLANFTLKLEDHGVKRPSLLSVSIENDVPLRFKIAWTRKD